jgi:hypothetical protein
MLLREESDTVGAQIIAVSVSSTHSFSKNTSPAITFGVASMSKSIFKLEEENFNGKA